MDDMHRRGQTSPDDGDALALTFACPVAKCDWAEEGRFDEALTRLKRGHVLALSAVERPALSLPTMEADPLLCWGSPWQLPSFGLTTM